MTDDTYFQCLALEPKHTRVKSSVVALVRTDTTQQGAQAQGEQTADTERNEQEKQQIMRGYADTRERKKEKKTPEKETEKHTKNLHKKHKAKHSKMLCPFLCVPIFFVLRAVLPKSRRGFTRQPENSKRAHFRAPALQTPPKFHEKTAKRAKKGMKIVAGEGKKKGAPRHLRGPSEGAHPSGPHSSGHRSGPSPTRIGPARPTFKTKRIWCWPNLETQHGKTSFWPKLVTPIFEA